MWRVLMIASLIFGISSTVSAEETKLYKDYFFGQEKSSIKKIKGVKDCGEDIPSALCLDGQKFADSSWDMGFIFDENKLVSVELYSQFDDYKRYERVIGVLLNGGFAPVFMGSEDKNFDALTVRSNKNINKEQFTKQMVEFEDLAMRSGAILYAMVPAQTPELKSATSYIDLLQKSPPSLRAVEVEIAGDEISVRFIAPAAVIAAAKENRKSMKEDF